MTYVLVPDLVRSRRDGQLHFVDANQLARLYGLPPPPRTLVAPEGRARYGWRPPADAVFLGPRSDGDYRLPR